MSELAPKVSSEIPAGFSQDTEWWLDDDNEYLCLQVTPLFEYAIEYERLREKDWESHLETKIWMTPARLRQFTSLKKMVLSRGY